MLQRADLCTNLAGPEVQPSLESAPHQLDMVCTWVLNLCQILLDPADENDCMEQQHQVQDKSAGGCAAAAGADVDGESAGEEDTRGGEEEGGCIVRNKLSLRERWQYLHRYYF